MTLTLTDLTERTGLAVDAHLTLTDPIPVLSGIQAQGDVMAIPADVLPTVRATGCWADVPAAGVVLVAGAHPHILVADDGTCRYTTGADDPAGLAVALVDASAPVWLLHPEHGGTGLAAGAWIIRRQREQAEVARLVAD